MPKQYLTKPFSKTAILGFTLGLAVIIAAILAVAGYRLGWWRQIQAFTIFEWAAYSAVIAFIASLIGLMSSRPKAPQRGIVLAIMGIIFSLPVLTSTALFEYTAKIYPPINDISTDTIDPPSFWDVPNPVEYPGQTVADQQLTAYADLKPLLLSVTPQLAFDKALKLIVDKGWEVIAQDDDEGRIEAVDSSLIFGFKDEVVIRITEADNGTIVDMRSRSRIGRIDRGANAKRIRHFLNDLNSSVSSSRYIKPKTVT